MKNFCKNSIIRKKLNLDLNSQQKNYQRNIQSKKFKSSFIDIKNDKFSPSLNNINEKKKYLL